VRHENSVFHDVLKHLPFDELERLVALHGTDDAERGFDTKSHLVALIYAQLSRATGLREIANTIQSHGNCLYHLGITAPRRATFADANKLRARSDVFCALLETMIKRVSRQERRRLDGITYLIDSTSLALDARSAGWAQFSARLSGVKLHIVYDPGADRPVYWAMTPANVNDITIAKAMPITPGATYVFDLGYYDYGWWAELDAQGCRLVTRLKRNTPLTLIEERPVPHGGDLLSDRVGRLPQRQAKSRKNPFQKPMREVRVQLDTGKVLRILSNDLEAPAQQIADLYKQRWAIELLFRWVKQNLAITHFFGISQNAVRAQIAAALIAFLLLRLAQATQSIIASPKAFFQLVRANLMHRRDLRHLLGPPPTPPPNLNQLVLI
jgi:hypothetical protein